MILNEIEVSMSRSWLTYDNFLSRSNLLSIRCWSSCYYFAAWTWTLSNRSNYAPSFDHWIVDKSFPRLCDLLTQLNWLVSDFVLAKLLISHVNQNFRHLVGLWSFTFSSKNFALTFPYKLSNSKITYELHFC